MGFAERRDSITDSAYRAYVTRRLDIVTQLGPDPFDSDINRPARDLSAQPVDRLHKMLAREHPAVGPDQGRDQTELEVTQGDHVPSTQDLSSLEVDLQVAVMQSLSGQVPRRASTHESVDPGHQLGRAEGLGQIVIGAFDQPSDAVADGSPRGHHENGQIVALVPEVSSQNQTVHTRQHYIQHYKVRTVLLDLAQCVLSIHRCDHCIAGPLQVGPHQFEDFRIVIDNQYRSCLHGLLRWYGSSSGPHRV